MMLTEELKKVMSAFLNNQKLPAIIVGTYDGSGVRVNEKFKIPAAQLSGNMKVQLRTGDKVRMIAGTGWEEFYVLEIIERRLAFKVEIKEEALK